MRFRFLLCAHNKINIEDRILKFIYSLYFVSRKEVASAAALLRQLTNEN